MIALIGNLDITELLIIALFSVMIFGRNLPRVAAQVVTHVTRARRALQKVWRESGIGEEIRDVQREIERNAMRLRDADPRAAARRLTHEIEAKVREPISTNREEATADPDAVRAAEPQAELERRPDWYPENLHTPSSEEFVETKRFPAGPAPPDPASVSEQAYAAGPRRVPAPDGGAENHEPGETPEPEVTPDPELKTGE